MKWQTRVLFASITCLLVTVSLGAQKEVFVPANDVSFTISTQRHDYRSGDRFTLMYRITNVSNAPLYVPRGQWEVTCPASPHVWAWFEDSSGRHFIPGYAGSCSESPKTVTERMSKEAILLKPGEHLDGTLEMDTSLFGGLKPGNYRIEAVLWSWRDERFTEGERTELGRMGHPFLRGEVPSSIKVTLTGSD